MYGLLHSANRRLSHLAAAPALRACSSAAAATAGIDDLVYVGKGYKICGKDEIEGQIRRNIKTIYQTKKRNKIHSNGRKLLPPELRSRNVARLTCDSTAAGGICDVYLVGSVHNCPETWREVENVISFLKPEITVRRLLATMSPWVFVYDPFYHFRKSDFPGMTGKDIDPYLAVEMIRKKFPAYAETVFMERDRYMSAKILEVACEHNSVVAVVGREHLAGIQKYWKQPVDMKEMQEILSIPAGNTFGAMVTYLFLSPSQREKIGQIMSDVYSIRPIIKNNS